MTNDHLGCQQFDEIRVITLPPPQTAAVNRLLREEEGWRLLEARVSERARAARSEGLDTVVVYVLGHVRSTSSVDQGTQAPPRAKMAGA